MAELAQLGPFLYTPDGQRAPRKRKKSGPRATKIFRLPFCINHAIVATGGAMLGGVVPVACEPDGNPVCVVRGYRRSHGPINRCMRLHVYTFIHLHVYTFTRLYIYTFIHLYIYTFIHYTLYVYAFMQIAVTPVGDACVPAGAHVTGRMCRLQ